MSITLWESKWDHSLGGQGIINPKIFYKASLKNNNKEKRANDCEGEGLPSPVMGLPLTKWEAATLHRPLSGDSCPPKDQIVKIEVKHKDLIIEIEI